jgi:three-Cys-motif partner protein
LTEDADPYRGREHSKIKHSFLRRYLRDASAKVLSRAPSFNYVDGFAGPWSVSDANDYTDSSFGNALEVLTDMQSHYLTVFKRSIPVRFFLCEKNKDRYELLLAFAKNKSSSIQIMAFHGAFEDHLDEISASCSTGFTFTFIDPTGWNVRSAEIARFLRSVRGDFLLNYMSAPISRHLGLSSVEASFARFLDDAEWKAKLAADQFPERQERKVLNLLKGRLKELGAAEYLPDFEIRRARENRIQMRLVLGSKHPDAVTVFRQVQREVEREEVEMRRNLAEEGSPQRSLFSAEQLADMDLQRSGVGCATHKRAAMMLSFYLLRSSPDGLTFKALSAHVMELIPVRLTDMKDTMVALRSAGKASYELSSARAKKPDEATLIRAVDHATSR